MRGRRRDTALAAPMPAAAVGALVLLLGACGGEGADDPSDTPAPPYLLVSPSQRATSPTPTPDRTPRARVVDVVALSGAGGSTDPVLTPVVLPADEVAFAAQLEPAARGPLRAAFDDAEVPPGLELRAAVVAIGCDEPADVLLNGGGGLGWSAQAVPPKSTVQCLVPVTFVVLAAVPF